MEDYVPKTIEDSIAECDMLRKTGKIEGDPFSDGDFKIGDIKKCNDCDKDVEVVSYNGLGQFSKQVIVHCEEHSRKYDDIFDENEKCPKCTDDKCEFHKEFDEEEYIKDTKRIRETRKKIKEMLDIVDPKTDSIMEYDRIYYITAQMFHTQGPDNWDFWLYDGFINYLGLRGRLHV